MPEPALLSLASARGRGAGRFLPRGAAASRAFLASALV